MVGPFTDALACAVRCHPDRNDFEEVGLRAAEHRFGQSGLIFAPGDPDDQLYFLLEGTVRLYKSRGGYKEVTIALLRDGGVFGELDLERGGSQGAFAEAVTESRVAKVRKADIVEVMGRSPGFAAKLLYSFSDRLRQSDEVIDALLERGVSARLAALLANLGDRFGETNGSGTVLNVRLRHQDLANMIASTRESVSKVMSEFRRGGLIEVRDGRIAITPLLGRTSAGPTMRN